VPLTTGSRGDYHSLEADCNLCEYHALCPEAIIGRYLASRAVDSGEFCPSPEDERNGWQAVDGIAYSRRLDSVDALPQDCCCTACGHYDEWYCVHHRSATARGHFLREPVYRGRGHGQGVPLRQLLRFRFSDPAYAYEVWPCCGSSWTGRGRSRTWPAVTSACQ
jgi:hypothetical protein